MMDTKTGSLINKVKQNIDGSEIFGHSRDLELILAAWLAGGHILIEGPPGTAKTKLARLIATLIGKSFKRIQFTSDLLPADITGSFIYRSAMANFELIKGPIFSDVVLADEINRCPPRTQSALLEAMEEKQVTLEGQCFPLSEMFFVVATQNPRDYEGTFPLPEVQLDRFMMNLVFDHGDLALEQQILSRNFTDQRSSAAFEPNNAVISSQEFHEAKQELSQVQCDQSLFRYVAEILQATRQHPSVYWGSSVRGGQAILALARVGALLENRQYLIPDDIKNLCIPVLRHRLKLNPEAMMAGTTSSQIISDVLEKVRFPT